MSNVFCNFHVENSCGNSCNQGYQVTETYDNKNIYQNTYQNNYSPSYRVPTQINNQPVTTYQTTNYAYSNNQNNNDYEIIKSQNQQYNMGTKHLNGDSSIVQPIVYPTLSPTSNINHITEKNILQEISNYTSSNENVLSSNIQQISTTPFYIRSTKSIYNPDFNFPLYFATTTSTPTSTTDFIKINLKKQVINKINKKDTYIKKDDILPNNEYDNNSSINLYPKKSETFKPITQKKEYYNNNSLKKDELHDIELKEDNDKIAGLNYFNDPINISLSNSIYDEVVPFYDNNDNNDQIEVSPSSLSTSDLNTKSLDIEDTVDYNEDNNIDRRFKAKASKQYKKDDPIITNIINDDLIKIPLESTYERCNDENLLQIMKNNMLASPVISKQLIFSSWKKEYNENLDVVCSKIPFSYTVVSSSIYCEIQTVSISCFAYIQPTNRKY